MERRFLILLAIIVILNYVNTAPKSSTVVKRTRSRKAPLKNHPVTEKNSLSPFEIYPKGLTDSELNSADNKRHSLENTESQYNEKTDLEKHAGENNDKESSHEVNSEVGFVEPAVINHNPGNSKETSLDREDIKELHENYSEDKDKNSNGNDNNFEANVNNDDSEREDENSKYNDHNGDAPKLQFLGLGNEKRSLMSGDTFTPSEMLPITEKLISKVEKPGEGKGIVSSATSPHQLADRLFEAFFFTPKRIVTLKDFDISGLDALQALALSGEPAMVRTAAQSVTEATRHHIFNLRGQYVDLDTRPRMCHYRLVTKKVNRGRHRLKTKRRVIALAKKLAKKRRLVVKGNIQDQVKTTKQRNRESLGKSKQRVNNGSKKRVVNLKRKVLRRNKNKPTAISGQEIKHLKPSKGPTNEPKSACNWHYECRDVSNLDTCRLLTKCIDDKNETPKDDITIQHNEDEHTIELKRFRKMLGISIIDEEVEKILESRIINLKPGNMNGGEKFETLTEYFNSIIMAEHLKSTTPKSAVIVELSTEKWTGELPKELSDGAHSDEKYPEIHHGATMLTTRMPKNNKKN